MCEPLMEKSLELSPVEMLKRMVAKAFPDRRDILDLEVGGIRPAPA